MSDRIKKIKVKKADGSMTDYIPIGVDAENVDFDNGFNLDNIVGSINPDESGDIATQLSKSIKYYDCVADMKADTTLNGGAARTLGYYEPGDGGGAIYNIVDDSSLVDDGGSVHNLENGLKAKLVTNGEVNVLSLGVKNDNSIDISSIINTHTQKYNLYFPAGQYKVSNEIYVKHNIRGEYFSRGRTNGIGDATYFISAFSSGSNSTGILNISNIESGFNLKGIAIKCKDSENGIYGNMTGHRFMYLQDIAIYNVSEGNGIYIKANEFYSRMVYLNNITVFGTREKYSHSTGIRIETTGDVRMSNIEIMGCRVGIVSRAMTYGNNFHIWGGPLQGRDNGSWWADTRGMMIGEGFFNNVYIDSCFVAIVGDGQKQYCTITNLVTMLDSSMAGTTRTDSSNFYNFYGQVIGYRCDVCQYSQYLLSECKMDNVIIRNRLSNEEYFSRMKNIGGSRYYNLRYGWKSLNFQGKMLEVAKIWIDTNASQKVTFEFVHAQDHYGTITLHFKNGEYSSATLDGNNISNNFYIGPKDSNNMFSVYYTATDYVTNGYLGISANRRPAWWHAISLIDLGFQQSDGNIYTPTMVDKTDDFLATLTPITTN